MNTTDEISVDQQQQQQQANRHNCNSTIDNSIEQIVPILESRERTISKSLKYLPKWPAVNLEFQDLGYAVPQINGSKVILRGISGRFRSSQLTAILGPSGAGKSTLLNCLAGFKTSDSSGSILVNGQPRNMKLFRKMSRYIMQEDIYQPMLSVREAMMVSADLKLGNDLTKSQKNEVIDEILGLLRLTSAADTMGERLSGGEKKRLSIALELVNNPPVIFLDEPTTGLDDLSCSQCISLLRRIAHGGRTIICSIHTPSAKIFEMFDHVYALADGQCVYQGHGMDIVPYMQTVGLNCPVTHNPADFIIEVSAGEYGHDYIDRMVSVVDNGRVYQYSPHLAIQSVLEKCDIDNYGIEEMEEEISPEQLKSRSSNWDQFKTLYSRRTTQMWRDANYMKLRIYMTFFLAIIVGLLYQGCGNDATKALFNFGFCFTITIAFMYNPMMPILLQFPFEVELVKREHFNRWFRIGPYYVSMIVAKLPMQIALSCGYLTVIYVFSEQPMEWNRILMFYSISLMIALTSESLGVLISSRLSLINGMFVGPVLTVPLMLLAVYGIGYARGSTISPIIKIIMSFSYLRYGLEGLIDAMYGFGRKDTFCPKTEMYCLFQKATYLKELLGFEDASFAVSMVALIGYYLLFTIAAYYMIKIRISTTASQLVAVQYIGRFVKTHLNFASYNYK